jgi:phasin family protein
MAKTEARKNGFFDLTKAFGDFRMPGFDIEALVASQRKNLEALTQASQLALEGAQAVAQRHVEIVRQVVDEVPAVMREWTAPCDPEDRVAKNVDVAKQAFETCVANARELAEITTKAGTDVVSVLTRRFSESFDDLCLYAKKHLAVQ